MLESFIIYTGAMALGSVVGIAINSKRDQWDKEKRERENKREREQAYLASVDDNGNTPLHLSARDVQYKAPDYLAPDYSWWRQNTDRNNTFANLKYLIKATIRNSEGDNVLHVAIKNGNLFAVKQLIAYYSPPASNFNFPNQLLIQPDQHGEQPLSLAAKNGNLEIFEALLNAGVDPNLRDRNGTTPLYWAIKNGHISVVNKLLEKTDLNQTDDYGKTYLHLAAFFDRLDVVYGLLARGANPNKPDIFGATPLHLAIIKGHRNTADALFVSGAYSNLSEETPFIKGCTEEDITRLKEYFLFRKKVDELSQQIALIDLNQKSKTLRWQSKAERAAENAAGKEEELSPSSSQDAHKILRH